MIPNAKPLKARYVGYVKGSENHGDEALQWLIRDLLAPEIRIVNEDEYDFALLGGGTLINQSPWLIDLFAETLDRSRSGRGLVFGTGVGDTAFWGDHFDRWRPLLERCEFVGVRGPDSVALLEQNGFHRAEEIGDPYLQLRAPIERPTIPRRLGVNLGGTNKSLWGGDEKDFLDAMVDALRLLRERGWSFDWISVWSKDFPLLEGIRWAVDPDSAPVLDARAQTLEAYSAIAGCELFLGEKLHACAMAAVAGVPFVGLEYQPKVRDFSASIGMEAWTIRTSEREPDKLIGLIETLAANRAAVHKRMTGRRDLLREKTAAFLVEAKRRLGAIGSSLG
jgi:polysaccharide pyruvyl transferase WcaK-like protein